MRFLCIALGMSVVLPLFAVDGELLAESGDSPTFSVYSADGATYATGSTAEIAALPPVVSRSGETVTVTSPSGGLTPLSSSSLAGVLDAGGVWTLVNSAQGSARVGVAWNVYSDGGTLASGGAAGTYDVDSEQFGPDRRIRITDMLPVAYTGDDWAGDAMAAATLTFVSPEGISTTLNLTGTGATTQFRFGKSGNWTVTLEMANGSTRTAVIRVIGGLTIIIC